MFVSLRGRELAGMMERRVVLLSIQESRWIGNEASDIGVDCEIVYSGANPQGKVLVRFGWKI